MTHDLVHPVHSGKPSAPVQHSWSGHIAVIRQALKKHRYDSRGRPDSLINAALESLDEIAAERLKELER